MNKEQQIEEMVKDIILILDRNIAISPRSYNSMEYEEKYSGMGVDYNTIGIATAFINAGYGNINEAVKEFAEKLQENLSKRMKDNIGLKYSQSVVQSFHDKAQRAVVKTLKEFCGEDKC